METTEPMIMVSFRLDPETYTDVLVLAEIEGRTVSDLLRQAAKYYLKVMQP